MQDVDNHVRDFQPCGFVIMKSATNNSAESNKKRKVVLLLAIFVFLLCLAYGYFFLLAVTTTTWELAECARIGEAVKAENVIPASISRPGSPGFFCDLGVRYPFLLRFDDIKIYGITDRSRQDAIVETLKRYREHTHTRPLHVQFYESENWQYWSNPSTGVRGGRRGPEVPIRVIYVK